MNIAVNKISNLFRNLESYLLFQSTNPNSKSDANHTRKSNNKETYNGMDIYKAIEYKW